MVALPNTKIDSSMIEEFSTPIFDEHNRDTYMYVDEYGKVIYKDITALIDDINEDGGIIGTNNKVVIRDWEPNYEYQEKETITYNNAIWKCIVEKSKKATFDINDWKMLAGYSKSSQFFYDAENEIEEIVLEEEVASKGSFIINVNNLMLQSNNYSLEADNKTITFANPIPKDTQIEVTVFGNMIIPTNVDNVVTKTFTTIADGETEFFVDEKMLKKDLVTVNVENTVLLQSEWDLNTQTDGIILKNGVPAGTRVQIQYFNNLDLSIGATFTPHISKVGRTVTLSWTNDQDLPNPQPVEWYDGVTFTPTAEKVGKKSTISWTNDGDLPNPQTLNIFDGSTFTPHVSKSGYITSLFWTNDGDLPNPQNVQIKDGINYIPSAERDGSTITISWENDQGGVNPDDVELYDGTTFTPEVEKIGKTTTISWSNDGGKENPEDVDIIDGSTYTPTATRSGNQVIISWSNDGGLPNPQSVSLYDGTTFTPSWTKSGRTANISWTNDGGKQNPPTMQLFDGVTFTPHTSRTGSTTTIYWTNDGGLVNPAEATINDGAVFTPHITDYGYVDKKLSWTNEAGLPNPDDAILIGGVTFTPVVTVINDHADRISWTNNGGLNNPASIDVIDGATFTPVVTKVDYTASIAWTNDRGKTNPDTVQIKDGIIYLPHTAKNGIKTTLSWSNDQGAGNPPSTIISDGATFTPSVSKTGKVATISWTNNDNLPNPNPVTLSDAVNYTPVISKSGYTTTLSWTNDSGLPNPNDSYIYDGATFTPSATKSGLVTTISWSNGQGLPNPNSFDIYDGTTFTPRVVKNNYETTISWSNDGGKANPSTVVVTDGVNWTPHIVKDDIIGTTVLSFTNDQGRQNPEPVEIYDGKVNDVLINGTSVVTNRIASFTLGTMAQESKDDYVLLTTYNNKVAELEQADEDLDDKIDAEITRATDVEGDLTQLATEDKTDLVSAINELHSDASDISDALQDEIDRATQAESDLDDKIDNEITRATGVEGTLSNLTTDAKGNLVSAINEVDSHTDTNTSNIGTLSSLTTTDKNNLVAAINEVDSDLSDEITRATTAEGTLQDNIDAEETRAKGVEGTLSSLTTDAKGNLVSAINEVDSHTDTNTSNIGTLSSLTTDAKNNLVAAINEVDSHTDTNTSNIGTLSSLTTDAKGNLVSAINEVDSHTDTNTTNIGDLTTLSTTDKTDLVSAINEVYDNAGDIADDLADHIADTNNPHQVTKAQVGLGNVDNTADIDKPVSTAQQTALDGKVDKTNSSNQIYGTAAANTQTTYTLATTATGDTIVQRNADGTVNVAIPTQVTHATTKKYVDDADATKVDKVNTAKRVYGTDASGNQTTYDYDSFGKVDDVKVAGTSVVTNKIANLGSMASETASDYTKTADLADIALSGSWNDLDDTPTTISGYGITDAYTKTEVDGLVASTFRYKGSVNTYSQLPTTGQVVGDVWNVATADTTHGIKAGDNVCWDGSDWDVLAGVTDLSVYDNHIANTSNPHQVTKAQVGLGNVDNTSDLNKPISTATQTALNGKVSDVKVGTTSVVTNMVANLGTMAGETASDYSTKAVADTLYADIAYENTIDTHIADTSNPHSVTKAQVGLGNVDNTADLDKPISTATQSALNDKVTKTTSASKVYGTDASGTQTTYNVDSFGKVDDVKVGTTSVVNNKIATLGTMAGEDIADYATSTALSQEVQRATDRETALNTNIQNEITRATGIEQGLQSSKADASSVYTKTEIDNMLTGAMHFKGSVATVADLENIQNPAVGDMYNVTANGANYAWDGTQWVKMSETVDLSSYAQTSYVDQQDQAEATARANADALKVDKVTTPSRVYGTDELGQPITYGVSLFGNIDDVTVGGTSVVVNRVAPLGTMAGETATDYYTKTVADTTFAAKSVETTKVDKVATASKIYGTDSSGNQTTLSYGTSATASNIVQRDSNSQVTVPQTPTANGHATSKKYVDDSVATKVSKVNTASKVYGTDASGNQTTYDVTSFGAVDDVKVNGTSVVTNKIANVSVPVQSVNGDTGAVIVQAIKNQNTSKGMTKIWEGDQETYDAISVKDPNTAYLVEGYDSIYTDLEAEISDKQDKLIAGANINLNGNVISATVPDISGKQDTITGAATTITSDNLTANRALISNGSGKVAVSAITSTELGYLDNVTSNIQTQLDNKVAKVATANKVYGTDASGNQTTYDKNSFGAVDDVKVGTTSVVSNKIATLGTMAGETASNYSTTAVANTLYVGKVSTTSKVYGTDASGNQTTYDVESLSGLVDDVKVGITSVVTNKIANLGTMAGENTTDYYTKTETDAALNDKIEYAMVIVDYTA